MNLKTRTIEYELDGRAIKLVFSQATSRMGMHRSVLMEEELRKASEELSDSQEGTLEDFSLLEIAEKILRTVYYPSTMAGVISQEGFDEWPISYEEFANWPEDLGIETEKVLSELNPHWLSPDVSIKIAEEAKKNLTSTSNE
jgi:hypothetical protein